LVEITLENEVHPKFPKKQFIIKKAEILFFFLKWGRTTPVVLSFSRQHKNAEEVGSSSPLLQ
jgi:hypothetical protein